jgi:hypothetical protein
MIMIDNSKAIEIILKVCFQTTPLLLINSIIPPLAIRLIRISFKTTSPFLRSPPSLYLSLHSQSSCLLPTSLGLILLIIVRS